MRSKLGTQLDSFDRKTDLDPAPLTGQFAIKYNKAFPARAMRDPPWAGVEYTDLTCSFRYAG